MKLFVGGSKGVKLSEKMIKDKIDEWIAAETEILIGDCSGTDAAMQEALASQKYPNVTVYTVHEAARRNAGNWSVTVVPGSKPPFTFHDYRRKDAAMAKAADSGFMVWDGKSRGTFVNIAELLGLGKPVEVWLTEKQRSLTLQTLEELAALFPETAAKDVWLSADEQAAFLRQFMPSHSMQAYLASHPLKKREIVGIICGAPVPLEEKVRWMSWLSKQKNLYAEIVRQCLKSSDRQDAGLLAEYAIEDSFSALAGQIRRALRELHAKPGELFLLIEAWYDEELKNEKDDSGTPFLAFEKAIEYIRRDIQEGELDESCTCWYRLEKWVPDASGRFVQRYVYWLWMDRVLYFEELKGSPAYPAYYKAVTTRFSGDGQHLNLPIPFHAGDIVTVDCRPFKPLQYAVILEIGDNADCCCVQALCSTDTDRWIVGALKHGSLFIHNGFCLSPLYRLEPCSQPPLEKEALLDAVRDYIAGVEKKGTRLWEALVCQEESHLEGLTENMVYSAIDMLKKKVHIR